MINDNLFHIIDQINVSSKGIVVDLTLSSLPGGSLLIIWILPRSILTGMRYMRINFLFFFILWSHFSNAYLDGSCSSNRCCIFEDLRTFAIQISDLHAWGFTTAIRDVAVTPSPLASFGRVDRPPILFLSQRSAQPLSWPNLTLQ